MKDEAAVKAIEATTKKTWFSVAQAAELLGLSRRAIQLRAKKGKLEHKRVRSEETGRIRLMVYSGQLAELARTTPGTQPDRGDFIPRFTDPSTGLGLNEFSALTSELRVLDQSFSQHHDRLAKMEADRDRLSQELARALSALERERQEARRQEKSLHRFIDRQQEGNRGREEQLLDQVSRLARDLGMAEHQILLLQRSRTWWRRLVGMFRRP